MFYLKIKNYKIKNFIIFSVFVFSCFFVFVSSAHADPAPTSGTIKFKPQVTIDGQFTTVGEGVTISPTTIGLYIKAIYKYAIGIVGILAAVVLMFGGLLWLTAGGNANQVSEAKAWIGASLTGLLIALCSFMIMATINPALVEVGTIDATPIPSTGAPPAGQQSTVTNEQDCLKQSQNRCLFGCGNWVTLGKCDSSRSCCAPPSNTCEGNGYTCERTILTTATCKPGGAPVPFKCESPGNGNTTICCDYSAP